MNGTSADRLARLRWLLTGLFMVLNTAGLLLFAWLVLDADRRQGEQRLDAALKQVTPAVQRLFRYDDKHQLVTAMVGMDEMNGRCPQFAIVPTGAEPFQPHESRATCVTLDPAVQSDLAQRAVRADEDQSAYVRAVDGRLVRVFVHPFHNPFGIYVGAIVAAIDAQPEQDRHNGRVLTVAAGCLVLIGVLGVAGHMISGRAMRPAVAALEQQEILLSDIAHDLRKPVTSLRALAETAWRNPDRRDELLPRTALLAARMGGIIEGLLLRTRFAAGVQELSVEPVWLDQLVSAVVEENMPTDGGRLTFAAVPSRVVADPVLVQRAVANLIGNALQHGHRSDAPAVVHVAVEGGRVTVADEGPGIDAARAELAFERFSGTGGSGLGLPIVRWIAHAHGGVLRVYNADAGGAIFELVLPISGT